MKAIGTVIKQKNGLNATLIEAKTWKNCIVEFEDGFRKKCYYDVFEQGRVPHPKYSQLVLNGQKRLGEKVEQREGHIGELIEYKDCNHVIIRFEDGSLSKEVTYDYFKKGMISHSSIANNRNLKNDCIGEEVVSSCGLKVSIVEYVSYSKIKVRFEDGLEKWTTYSAFKNKQVAHSEVSTNIQRNPEEVIGETRRMKNGLDCYVIAYKTTNDTDFEFEDGTKVHGAYKRFLKGNIGNPNLVTNRINSFCGFKCVFLCRGVNDNVYYKVKHEDGFEGIMTPQEMLSYSSSCSCLGYGQE